MTHRNFVKKNYTVFAETEHSIFFEAYGEKIAEIDGVSFYCDTVEEFYDLVNEYEDLCIAWDKYKYKDF